ncbi:MAG: SH3 domain-containing protein [Pseudomonadota bacterium]|nr:SH3 domain-containing protein [Pseudomonadota bacterium]
MLSTQLGVRWATGLLLAVGATSVVHAETTDFAAELSSFLERIPTAPQRSPRSFKVDLPSITSSNGKRTVAPALELVAGRLDSHTCLYQLRVQLRWSGKAMDEEDAAEGGRSVLQKTACSALTQEATAVAVYEVSALQRRLQEGGRFASNKERDLVIAAARHAPGAVQTSGSQLDAVTIASRVNLRSMPSLKSPVLSKLGAASLIQVIKTSKDEWYQLQGRPGYIHASALASVHVPSLDAPPPAQIDEIETQLVLATVSGVRVTVREQPEKTAKVLKRLRPGTPLRLLPADVAGWFELDDGSGFVPDEGLMRTLKTGTSAAAGGGRGARSSP